MTNAVDPVCGMTVDTEQAVAREEYQGTTYYFCSEQCRQTFAAHPENYAAKQPGCHGHGGQGHGDD